MLNKKRSLIAGLAVCGAVAVVAGGLMASNMGFKLNRALVAAGGSSASGTNTLCLPYNRQVGIDTASQLFGDIDFTNVAEIQRFNPGNDSFTVYGLNQPDFALERVGYFVKMVQDFNYIVVGSHDPSAVIELSAAGAGSASGSNFYCPPYHSTAGSASELFSELDFTNVAEIQRFNPGNDSFTVYGLNQPDFALEVGKAYFVKMVNTLAFSPSHY